MWEIWHEYPVVELRLLRDPRFAIATFTMFGLGFVLYAGTMLLPIFLKKLMGYDALTGRLALSPGGGIAVVILIPLVGPLLSRFEPRWLVAFGLAVSPLGLFQMAGFQHADRLPHGRYLRRPSCRASGSLPLRANQHPDLLRDRQRKG